MLSSLDAEYNDEYNDEKDNVDDFGVDVSDICTLKKHTTYIHTSPDCEPLVFESFSKYSCGETHFWL